MDMRADTDGTDFGGAREGDVDVLGELAVATPELVAAVRALGLSVGALGRAQRLNRWLSWAAMTGVVLIVIMGGVLLQLWTATYVTQQQQVQTRVRVLCPLYGAFLSLGGSPARQALLTPLQRQALAAIATGYDVLGCAGLPPAPPPH